MKKVNFGCVGEPIAVCLAHDVELQRAERLGVIGRT